ncbi:MAG: polysaccharide biosynthesis protein [Firmicutes bacterium]|nr:polysaccharide biosynthesis protein [Bacillota bacterium]
MKNGKNLKKYRSILLHFVCDILFAVGAFWLAYFINYLEFIDQWPVVGDLIYGQEIVSRHIRLQMLIFVATTVFMLILLDNYNTVWKYAGKVDLYKFLVAYALTFIVLFIYMVIAGIFQADLVFTSMIIMFLVFSALASGAMRFSKSIFRYMQHLRNTVIPPTAKGLKKTIIIGAGYTGMLAVNRFMNNPDAGYIPVALIDQNENKHGMKICGILVEGSIEDIKKIATAHNVEAIIIAISNINKSGLREIYAKCREINLPVKIMPPITDADDGLQIETKELRDIRIEELLGRDEFVVQKELIDKSVVGQVVLVTGGAGSIGSELCRQAIEFGCKHLIIYETHENSLFELNQEFAQKYDTSKYTLIIGNVRDKSKLKEAFETYKPDVVFHAAAYKHVPMMEISACEAIKNNVFGTVNVIAQSMASDVKKLVFISTDKAVNPANIMGASKRIAEMCVEVYGKDSGKLNIAAVRFGNVLGSNGSVIPIFLKQIKEGGPITLTDRNIQRYFMTIPEAVRLVMQTGALADSGDVFVLDMGEPVHIYDLACDLVRINGLVPEQDIEIKITGLRPGEKMFEELRYDAEAASQTIHEGIFVNKMEDIDVDWFEKCLKRLKQAVDAEDNTATEAIIFELVPSVYREKKTKTEKRKRTTKSSAKK